MFTSMSCGSAITEQLLNNVHSDMELQELIAKHITDKYRFYDSHTDDVTDFTNDLLDIAENSTVDALSRPSNRDNSLRQSIKYLKKNSGLFTVLYKVFSIWGNFHDFIGIFARSAKLVCCLYITAGNTAFAVLGILNVHYVLVRRFEDFKHKLLVILLVNPCACLTQQR